MHKQGGQLRSLTDFCLTIQDKAIRSALQQYIVAGSMGHLLDAKRDGLAMGRFMTFEIEELMNLGERYCLPVLLYLFRRIEKSLKGQPSVILLDEAWLMLQHPVFKAKIHEWLKTMRKANCAVIMATQSLSDFTRSDIADVIISDTATKIFLPNQSAKEEEAAVLYQRFGLNERQIDIIATAVPKQVDVERSIRVTRITKSRITAAHEERVGLGLVRLRKAPGKVWSVSLFGEAVQIPNTAPVPQAPLV